jgi:hypothetical protein
MPSEFAIAIKELDPFSHTFGSLTVNAFLTQLEDSEHPMRTSQRLVRRPLRGIQIKEDTFASFSVFNALHKAVPLRNSSAKPGDGDIGTSTFDSNFILTGVQEERSEKFQAISTFSHTFGFFFGEQPRVVTFSALLLNTADFQWEIEWWHNYEHVLRGTALTEKLARAYLAYDDQIIEGYLIRSSTQKNSQNPHEVPLTFTMWVTGVETIVEPGSARYPDTGQYVSAFDSTSELFQSSTLEVRQRNLSKLTERGTGLLATLRNAISDIENVTGAVAGVVDDVKNFLFGRNLVIPAGFAGSELLAGQAQFASGSFSAGFQAELSGLFGNSVTLRLPAVVVPSAKARSFFINNVDEYPALDDNNAFPTAADRARLGPKQTTSTEQAVAKAEAEFASVGIVVSNETGSGPSPIQQFLGRAVYAAVMLVDQVATDAARQELESRTASAMAKTRTEEEEAKADAEAEAEFEASQPQPNPDALTLAEEAGVI